MSLFKKSLVCLTILFGGYMFAAESQPQTSIVLGSSDLRKIAASTWFIAKGPMYGATAATLGYVGHALTTQPAFDTVHISRSALKDTVMVGGVMGLLFAAWRLPSFLKTCELELEKDRRLALYSQLEGEVQNLKNKSQRLDEFKEQIEHARAEAETRAINTHRELVLFRHNTQCQMAELQRAAEEAAQRTQRIEQAGRVLMQNQAWGMNMGLGNLSMSVASLQLQIGMARQMRLSVSSEQEAALALGTTILSSAQQLGISPNTALSVNMDDLRNALEASTTE